MDSALDGVFGIIPNSVVPNFGRALQATSRDSHVTGLVCALAIGIFKSFTDDSKCMVKVWDRWSNSS